MYHVFGPKFWITVGVYAGVNVLFFSPKALALLGLPSSLATPQYAILIIDILIAVLLFTPLWRLFWRLPFLGSICAENIFPDLNGEYRVTIKSNYSINKRLAEAAAKPGQSFDLSTLTGGDVDLSEIKLRGIIKQSWFSISVTLIPVEKTKGTAKHSRTLVCTALKSNGPNPPQLAYVYEQKNQNVQNLDEKNFLGAALIEIPLDKTGRLTGDYWSNRAWRKGMNTAGLIEFERIRK